MNGKKSWSQQIFNLVNMVHNDARMLDYFVSAVHFIVLEIHYWFHEYEQTQCLPMITVKSIEYWIRNEINVLKLKTSQVKHTVLTRY